MSAAQQHQPYPLKELTACPRCGAPVEWVALMNPRATSDILAVCTRCTWGED